MSNEMLPRYSTKLFCEMYEEVNDFIYDYNNIGIPKIISVQTATTLYYLLYAKFGNNPIANYDEEQWKYKIFSIIWQYGPAWEKRLDIQTKLRALTEEDLVKGSKAIYNHANNPNQAPSTATLDEVEYINDQSTANHKKSKMDAYAQLWDLISTDVTAEFLSKFNQCFKTFVFPERPLLYVTDVDEDEIVGDEDNG
jgi:hypothetical protein